MSEPRQDQTIEETIKDEEMALTVDHQSMIRNINRNLLSDKYAYIKDILSFAAETNAKSLQITNLPTKIRLVDDGEGMAEGKLVDRLCTLFTPEGKDDLASGILAAFDAGIDEVVIESAPPGKEPYALRIFYDPINTSGGIIPEVEKVDLPKNIKRGSRITLKKKKGEVGEKLLETIQNVASSYFRSIHTPEIKRAREACQDSVLEVTINHRKVKNKKKTEEYIASVSVDQDGITGTVGLALRPNMYVLFDSLGRLGHRTANSKVTLYRKGFFHGELLLRDGRGSDPLSCSYGPICGKINYDGFKVDISGESIWQDKSVPNKIQNAIRAIVPDLYKSLLEEKKHPTARRAHLLHYTRTYICSLTKQWMLEQGKCKNVYFSSNVQSKPDCAEKIMERLAKEVNPTVFTEKLYKTKEHGMVSLAFLLEQHEAGKRIVVDQRESYYDLQFEATEDHLIVDGKDDDLVALVLSAYSDTLVLRPKYSRLVRWGSFHSSLLHNPKKEYQSARSLQIKQKWKIPLIYRPVQALTLYAEEIKLENEYHKTTSNLPSKRDPLDALVRKTGTGLIRVGTGTTILAAALGYGAVESVYRTLKPVYQVTKKGAKVVGKATAAAVITAGGVAAVPIFAGYHGIKSLVKKIGTTVRQSANNTALGRKISDYFYEREIRKYFPIPEEKKKERKRTEKTGRKKQHYQKMENILDTICAEEAFPRDQAIIKKIGKSFWKRDIFLLKEGTEPVFEIYYWNMSGAITVGLNEISNFIRSLISIAGKSKGNGHFGPYLGSYLIDEAKMGNDSQEKSDRQNTMQVLVGYQQAVLRKRIDAYYQDMLDDYRTGKAEEFIQKLSPLGTEKKVGMFYQLLHETKRCGEIDQLIDTPENKELLQEAGAQYLKEISANEGSASRGIV